MEYSIHPERDSFSLVRGGPLYQLMVRMRLVIGESYIRMAIFFVVLSWFPLLILSVWQGSATGADVQIPFLRDYAVHARFLISLPILILAEGFIDSKLRKTIGEFNTLSLITPEDMPRFNSAIRDVHVWRDSALAEAFIAIVAVIQSYFVLSNRGWFSARLSSWHTQPSLVGNALTIAGWWLGASLAAQISLQGRWFWRLLIWTKLLARINKLDLQLIPTHPDRAGGLAFVGKGQIQFGLVVFAISAAAAGAGANLILFEGQALRAFERNLVFYILLMTAIFISPMFVFMGRLHRVKKKGRLEYSALAMEYVRSFDSKWLRNRVPTGESLLGSSDIQSLADMINSFNAVREMRIVPLDRKVSLTLLCAAA
ncbi:MAG TPA: hypothetical protein VNO32_31970, partial [Candidatus Acidoferrum sp.]|nr:hypothetical protein [Candidatus Acidoferrum sp.]